jgi:hypothetical protein
MAFPTTLDTASGYVENDRLGEIEAKIGADSSAVATSLDYKLCNASSTDPGHLHTAASISDVKTGTFTCANNKDKAVSNTAVTANSKVFIMPTNAAAAALMAGINSLYVSALSVGASFTVTTGNADAAAGTETFNYLIIG